jgi:hypothetical protein
MRYVLSLQVVIMADKLDRLYSLEAQLGFQRFKNSFRNSSTRHQVRVLTQTRQLHTERQFKAAFFLESWRMGLD